MHTDEHLYRVNYSDTDQMGVVYYGNYATLYEIGRTEMLRKKGLSYKEIEAMGVMLPVVKMTCTYKKPALYDDLLTIKTIIKEEPTSKICFYTEIYNEKGDLLNSGEVVLVFVNSKTMRPMRAPKHITDLFEL